METGNINNRPYILFFILKLMVTLILFCVFPYIVKADTDTSIIKWVMQENLTTGNYNLTVNDETYAIELYVFDGDTTYTANPTLCSTTPDDAMCIVKYNGNLTIDAGVTLTPVTRKKGFFIFVNGTLTNNGLIHMNGKGSSAAGQNVYLWQNADGTYEYVPATGAVGAKGTASSGDKGVNANSGSDGVNRQTGGGGGGGNSYSSYNGKTTIGGAGSAGTSYSGGAGGGGGNHGWGASTGNAIGTMGGACYGVNSDNRCQTGVGITTGAVTGNGWQQTNLGTGGLLIVYAPMIINNGTISANGVSPAARPGASAYSFAHGGASGGGSVNVFFATYTDNDEGMVLAQGGVGKQTNGSLSGRYNRSGDGGAGSVTLTTMVLDENLLNPTLYSLSTSPGSLVPNFDPETFTYNVALNSEQSRITISGSVIPGYEDDDFVITGLGTFENETPTDSFLVTVTSKYGFINTYVINTTRPASSYRYLDDILVNGESIGKFNPTTLTYDINLEGSQEEVDLDVVRGRTNQTVYGTGTIAVDFGTTTHDIVVVSEDGSYTTTYKVRFYKAHTTLLKSLIIDDDNYDLNPDFESELYNYSVTLMPHTLALKLTAIPYDSSSTVTITGNGYIKAGSNAKITITVTNPNASPSVSVYTIDATREETVEEQIFEYPYTGTIQEFVAPATGFYQLEAWGAQGGSATSTYIGGYGAYSTGVVKLKRGDTLYITVGEQGKNCSGTYVTCIGGYNGGGAAKTYSGAYAAGGGGASHISLTPGLLTEFANNKEDLVLVAGAGGGGHYTNGVNGGIGGSGGGYVGMEGTKLLSDHKQKGRHAYPGTQISAGCNSYGVDCGAFGLGGSSKQAEHNGAGSGGGSGFYGGSAANISAGAGGSGYIGYTNLVSYDEVTKSMYCYNCTESADENTYTVSTTKYASTATSYYAKSGNGYVRISLMSPPSEDNFLQSLTVKATNYETEKTETKDYTPDFDLAVEDYYVELDVMETSITISARPQDSKATIDGLGTFDVPAGDTTFVVTVTAESDDIKEYKVHVHRPASSEIYPIDIVISGLVPSLCMGNEDFCKLNPEEFDKNIDTYYITVPYRIKQLYFDVQKAHPFQNVKGEGKVTLDGGENVITIEIEAEDGSGPSEYTYYVTRDMTGDTDIDFAILDPERDINFDPDISEYYITVDNSYTKYVWYDGNLPENEDKEPSELLDEVLKDELSTIQLYIKTDDENAEFMVNGPDELETGLNEIQIVVTSPTGDIRIYALNVYRLKNENVFLSNIEVKKSDVSYELNPNFNKANLGPYQVTVPNDIADVDIIATPEVSTTKVGGVGNVALEVGENTVELTVTAENGTIEHYSLVITREKNSNANLSNITVSDDNNIYTLNPTFDKETLVYDVEVLEGTSTINIEATPEVSTTTYKLLDNNAIKVGNNVKRVMAIAEDGTSKTYTININRPASSNNYLEELTLSYEGNEFKLNPEFDKETADYTLEVANEVTYVQVSGKLEEPLARVSGLGKYSLQVGENTIEVSVTSESNETRYYTIVVTRKPSDNAYLSTLTASTGILVPDFDKDVFEYTLNAEYTVDDITFKATPEVATTSVTGDGKYTLVTGENHINIVTLAQDGTTTLTYKINVVKDKSGNNNIASLIMEEGKISPDFLPNIITYTAMVPHEVTQGTFHVVLEKESSTYEILNNHFEYGKNEVTIRVTSENGDTKDYMIEVTRQTEEEESNYLSSLTVSSGTLSPTFIKTQQFYQVEVPYEVANIKLDATTESPYATMVGTGEYNLKVGQNLLVITVTSTDGKTRDYQVEITRKKNTEARISSIAISNATLEPDFERDVYHYETTTTDASLDFSSIVTVDPEATYEILDNTLVTGANNVVTIKVTAADGIATKEYTIDVTKEKGNNNNLESLEVEGYTLVPAFSKTTTLYEVKVPSDVSTINILATAEDSTATVKGTGIKTVSTGENQYMVQVVSESGKIKVYTILVNKEGSNNNNILDLQVLNGTISPEFDKETTVYDVEVDYSEKSLDLIVILDDYSAYYEVMGNEDFAVGKNVVTVVVTAENGSIKTYTLNVTRNEAVTALLEDIIVKDYSLSPEFNSYINSYNILANYETEELDLTVIPMDKKATYVISGNENFVVGDNIVQIDVTSSDGKETETYYLNVKRQAYANTFLDYLYTDQGDVTPLFEKTTLEYSIDVPYDVTEIELIGELVDKGNSVTGLGNHTLDTGENIIPITVTSPSGIVRVYKVTVNRSKDDDNFLATLTAKVGGNSYDLTPEFERTHLEYTIDVPVGTQSINLQGTLSSDTSTVTGLQIHTLKAGTNEIQIVVTSESGKVRTYTVTVNRAANDNNSLIELTPSVGALEPSFNYLETDYVLNLDSSAAFLSFDVVTEDANATFTGNESKVVPDGVSTREIIVTAENGTTRTYTITVNKERTDNARLSSLSVVDYPFAEDFDPNVFLYHISVPNDKQILLSTEVLATTEDPNAKITKSGNITLETSSNSEYLVTVTAPDGFTKQVYKIVIEREKGNNTLLNSLIVQKGYLEEAFNPNVFTYNWVVTKNITLTSDDVIATAQDKNATITKTPSVTVSTSTTNQYVVRVTSEDGSSFSEYILNLIPDLSTDTTLGSLEIDKGYYLPEYDPYVYEYDAYVYEDETELTVTATANSEDAYVTQGNGLVTLDSDLVEHKIIVTAESGESDTYILRIHKSIKHDAGLKNLYLNGLDEVECDNDKCILNPTFDTDVLDYHIKVPFEYTNLNILAETMNEQQSVKIKFGEEYILDYELPLGTTSFKVEVYDGLGVLTRTYTLEVERCKSSDNYLKSLVIEEYDLEPIFDKYTQEYTIYVGQDVDAVEIEAEPENESARLSINGYNYLEEGVNDATITVVAPDGAKRTYIVHIVKTSEYNSFLKNITVSSGIFWDLEPKFSPTTFEYTTTITNVYDKVIVEATAIEPESVIVGTGEYELTTGSNIVTLVVTAPNGSTSTYTVNIIKTANNNVDLASLVVDEGPLSPAFDRSTTKYDVTVGEDADSLTILAIPYEITSIVTITGNENLQSGYNTVDVIVMNKDRTASKTYQLTVFKDKSSDNRLLELEVIKDDISYPFNPSFDPKINQYLVEVPYDTDIVTIKAIADSKYATVVGAGEEAIAYGSNFKTVMVTAENGATLPYVLDIYRNYNLDMASIITDVGTLDPVFDKDTLEYTINVTKDIDKISVMGTPESNKVTVEGNDTYNLVAGKNVIELKVVAPDGATKTYTITVNRDADDNNYLESLVVHEGGLDPLFDKMVQEYTTHVRKTTTSVELDVVPEHEKATYEVIGNENLVMGENEVIIRVKAENGDTRDYVLTVVLEEDDYFSNRLLNISISEGKLNPDFDPDTYYYVADLPNSTTSLIISATKESDTSTVIGTGLVNLEVGRNVFPVLVTSRDGHVSTYTLVIYREEANDATLSSLIVKNYAISPIFNKQTTDYKVTINGGEESVLLTALPTDKNATVEIQGNEDLKAGDNVITITVTAADGVTTKVYTLTVTKEKSTNNYLSSLVINGHEFTPEFDKTNNGPYMLEVESNVNSINIEAEPEVESTTVSGDGVHTLTNATEIIKVIATAESGSERVYTIIVKKNLDSDNTLKDLVVSDGELDPEFDPETLEYTVVVPEELTQITINGFANKDTSTVVGNGTYPVNGSLTSVPIIVTAEDGTSRTYVVNVTKEVKASSKIMDLIVKNGELQPHFNKNIVNYSVTVPNEVTSLDMIVILEDSEATYQIEGNENFRVGSNMVKVVVTSSEGETTTYNINVVRAVMASNYLSSLRVEGYEITPVFDRETLYYTLIVPNDVTTANIIATLEDASATVTGIGVVDLEVGRNDNYVAVTSASGVVRTYTVAITRESKYSSKIRDLIVKNGELKPHFDKDIITYDIDVPYEVTSLDMIVTLEDMNATYKVQGNSNFIVGKNTVNIIVTDVDGYSTIYTLNVNRGKEANNYLSNLEVEGYELTPQFDKETLYYTVEVPYTTEEANIIATLEDSKSSVTGDGLVALNIGRNDNYVTVTSSDGVVRTYTVVITRSDESNAKILDLIVKNGELKPHFDKDTTEYSVAVPNEVTALDMVVVLDDYKASYEIIGNENFVVGDNTVKVVVTGTSGNQNTYTINVTRGEDANNYLMDLEVEGYELTPQFDKETLYYTVDVPYNVSSVNIIATLDDLAASITGAGKTNIDEGRNDRYVTVTSSDGVVRTYTIVINRDSEFSSKIRDLIVKNGELQPHFEKNTTDYTVLVPNEVTSLDMIVTLEDSEATYSVLGNENFTVGKNLVQVIVTSKKGQITTYRITVEREEKANNYLTNIEVENHIINPTFDKETLYYTLTVDNDVTSVNIIATLEDSQSKVTGTGVTTLEVGRNDKYVTVTSSDGVVRTYTIAITRDSEFSSKIMDLIVKNGELLPHFDRDITEYSVAVPYEVTALDMIVTLEDETSTYEIIGNSNFKVGDNLVQVIVTSKTGIKTTYRIKVTRGEYANNYLTNLEVEGYLIVPTFNEETLYYTLEVTNDVTSVNIIATLDDPQSTVTGTGVTTLEVGRNDKYVTVTSSDGVVRTYTIAITRKDVADTKILDLIVKNGELKPHFDKDINNYNVAVPNEVTSLDMIVTLEDEASTYKIIGNENFVVGTNTVQVVVTGEDGTTNTYTINVTRGEDALNYLTKLEVENHIINPTFDKETLYYTLTVDNDVTSVNIIATLEDPQSSVTGTGVTTLEVGRNDKYVTVTSSDGVVRTYTIAITRDSEYSSQLLDLIVKNGELQPHFDKEITEYSVAVPNEVTSLDMIVTLEDETSTYEIVGNENFQVGDDNLVQVIVTSKTGIKTTYNIKVTRGEQAKNYLTKLEVEGYEIAPVFDKETLYYTLEVPNTVSSVNIIATLDDPQSSVTGTGVTTLNIGRNDKYVTVTSSDGVVRTYTIAITRKDVSNTKIMDLIVKNGELQPHFDKDINKYTVLVPYEVTSLDMIVTLDDYKSTYEITGNENFKVGSNTVKVIVTGEDGTTNTYTISVVRQIQADNYLANLEVEGYEITPVFDKETLYYTVNVPYNVDKANIIATLENPNSFISGDGIVNLEMGRNDNYVTVMSLDGVERTYTVVIYRDDEFSSKIMDLIVKNGELLPHFDKNITNYTVNVPYEVTSLDMVVTLEDNEATYSIIGNSNFQVGHNLVQVMVTSKDGKITTYQITVIRGEQANNYLTKLEVEGYEITPVFDKETLYYTLEVPNPVDKVNIIATLEDPKGTVTGTGVTSLEVGRNDKYVTVTSSDGVIRTYTIAITRNELANTKIMDLIVKNGELQPHFDKDTNKYTVLVPYEVTSLDMIVTLDDYKSTYEVIGNSNFVVGTNTVKVVVTGEDKTTNTYTISVVRQQQADNYLANLEVEGYELTPQFDKETLYYTVNVPYNVDKANIIATLENPSSFVSGDGIVNLDMGRNDNYVTVMSPEGIERTYTVVIYRDDEFSSKIMDLIVKNGELLPHFDKNITNYTVNVPYEVTSLDMVVTLEDNDATYSIIGNENFIVGNNLVQVIVTSKDGNKTTYNITVIRGKEANNYLTKLEVEDYEITPVFDKETLYYTLTVPNSVDKVNIIATLEDSQSKVTGTGVTTLEVGRNDKYVTVTSSDGVIRTYTIVITREEENDNKLLTLVSDIGTFTPDFEPTVNEYTLNISNTDNLVNLSGTVSEGATVMGLGAINVPNTLDHSIIVTSATGNINTYTIHIVKADPSTELIKLVPSAGEMEYSNDITEYEFEVDDNDSVIYFDYELKDPTATITGTDLAVLNYGENEIEIVVTATNGDTRTINIKVFRNKDLVAIIPEEDNIILAPEEEKDITYTFDPVDTTYTEVEFSIEDESIATVSEDGKVTAIEFGSTVLTIRSKHNPDVFATVSINVLSTKITSSILDVIRDVPEEECAYDTCEDIVIGEEPLVELSEFITKFDNDETYLHVFDSSDNEIEDMTTYTGSLMTLKLIINEVEYDKLTVVVRGDYNGDGRVNSVDDMAINNIILNKLKLTYLYLKIFDYNGDDKVNSVDDMAINNFILGKLKSMNAGQS